MELPSAVRAAVEELFPNYDDITEVLFVKDGVFILKAWAIEELARQRGITFTTVDVQFDAANRSAVATVAAECGLKDCGGFVITTGEAAPWNNHFNYPVAMAEKRAKGRAVLKLLGVHGIVYEDEPHEAPDESVRESVVDELMGGA